MQKVVLPTLSLPLERRGEPGSQGTLRQEIHDWLTPSGMTSLFEKAPKNQIGLFTLALDQLPNLHRAASFIGWIAG